MTSWRSFLAGRICATLVPSGADLPEPRPDSKSAAIFSYFNGSPRAALKATPRPLKANGRTKGAKI